MLLKYFYNLTTKREGMDSNDLQLLFYLLLVRLITFFYELITTTLYDRLDIFTSIFKIRNHILQCPAWCNMGFLVTDPRNFQERDCSSVSSLQCSCRITRIIWFTCKPFGWGRVAPFNRLDMSSDYTVSLVKVSIRHINSARQAQAHGWRPAAMFRTFTLIILRQQM